MDEGAPPLDLDEGVAGKARWYPGGFTSHRRASRCRPAARSTSERRPRGLNRAVGAGGEAADALAVPACARKENQDRAGRWRARSRDARRRAGRRAHDEEPAQEEETKGEKEARKVFCLVTSGCAGRVSRQNVKSVRSSPTEGKYSINTEQRVTSISVAREKPRVSCATGKRRTKKHKITRWVRY